MLLFAFGVLQSVVSRTFLFLRNAEPLTLAPGPFELRRTLPNLSVTTAQRPVIVTSLSWAPRFEPDALVATYLYHGVMYDFTEPFVTTTC